MKENNNNNEININKIPIIEKSENKIKPLH